MDNLGYIRLFVEAAQLGSLSAAGRRLALSPAAASARLTKLEASLGSRLFERSTRQLRLTDEGQLYLSHCQEALQTLDDARAALQAGASTVHGKIRIAATSDFGRNVLQGWLGEFIDRFPEALIALTLSDSLAHLLHDEIDLAIRFGAPTDGALVARRLAPNRRVLCASPAFLARHGVPQHPSDLSRFPCIALGSTGGTMSDWRFERDGVQESFAVPALTSLETNDGEISRAWSVEGRGIALKSAWDVSADLVAGRLVMVLPDWRLPDAPVYAVLKRGRYMPSRVRALLDFLAERFATVSSEIEEALAGPSADQRS